MTQTTLIPYLNFNGETQQAMKFYQQVLGGELTLQRFKDAPGMPVPPGYEEKILHARLEAEGLVIMASEGKPGVQVKAGDNVHLSLNGTDADKLTKVFNGLSAGGHVDMPLARQFWGDTFGALTDKFGIHWMVNVTKP
ncbi:MAG: VOC family protein [Deltaproteobacteria bacterium]|nr:VOC family protein [Deltaproteobacteria bacterium]